MAVLSSSERGALDAVLRPHLRLDPAPDGGPLGDGGKTIKAILYTQLRMEMYGEGADEGDRTTELDLTQSLGGAGRRRVSEDTKPIFSTQRSRSKSETNGVSVTPLPTARHLH